MLENGRERESYWVDIFHEQKAKIDVNVFLLMREVQLMLF